MAFEAENKTYADAKDKLVAEAEGQFVVVKGENILGPYSTYGAAYEQGLKMFGKPPFLVKQVLREEPVIFNPSVGTTKTNLHAAWQYSTLKR